MPLIHLSKMDLLGCLSNGCYEKINKFKLDAVRYEPWAPKLARAAAAAACHECTGARRWHTYTIVLRKSEGGGYEFMHSLLSV